MSADEDLGPDKREGSDSAPKSRLECRRLSARPECRHSLMYCEEGSQFATRVVFDPPQGYSGLFLAPIHTSSRLRDRRKRRSHETTKNSSCWQPIGWRPARATHSRPRARRGGSTIPINFGGNYRSPHGAPLAERSITKGVGNGWNFLRPIARGALPGMSSHQRRVPCGYRHAERARGQAA